MVTMLSVTSNEILAVVVAASFAAGLNVYATVATLGLLSHAHAFQLPPAMHILESWPVILVCALLFGLEFFADKIPVFDLIWNALNTFVKVPVATLLSYGAAQHLSPGLQVAVAALGGAIALVSHGSKLWCWRFWPSVIWCARSAGCSSRRGHSCIPQAV